MEPAQNQAQQYALRKLAVSLRLQKKSLNEIQTITGLSHPTIITAYKNFLSCGWRGLEPQLRGRPIGSKRLTEDLLTSLMHDLLSSPYAESFPNPSLWDIAAASEWLKKHSVLASEKTVSRYLKTFDWLPCNESISFSRKQLQHQFEQQHRNDTQAQALNLTPERLKNLPIFVIGSRKIDTTRSSLTAYQLYARDTKNKVTWAHQSTPFNESEIVDFLDTLHAKHTDGFIAIFKIPFIERHLELSAWLKKHTNVSSIAYTLLVNEISLDTDKRTNQPIDQQHLIPRKDMPLTHLQRLEAESIQIMREVVAETENPVMLYSIGKDSAVMLHIAMKAFYPSLPPFPLLHVDTRWKFREMYQFRDKMVDDLGLKLITHINPEAIEKDINPFTHGSAIHTDITKTEGLKQALNMYGFDAAFGGARRDEEKSRAKERIFSFRTSDHRWDPKNQRPELWKQYNARKHKGESIRVFPISNWTELDIWQYIYLEQIPIVPLYYSAERPVVERDGTLIMVDDERMPLRDGEVPMMKKVRFRTLGCYPLTGAVESEADTLPAIIQEMLLTNTSERQGRMIDHDSAASMEKKKQEGYF